MFRAKRPGVELVGLCAWPLWLATADGREDFDLDHDSAATARSGVVWQGSGGRRMGRRAAVQTRRRRGMAEHGEHVHPQIIRGEHSEGGPAMGRDWPIDDARKLWLRC